MTMVKPVILGGNLAPTFPPQFSNGKISNISLACSLIELLSNDGEKTFICHASGFFWRYKQDAYLVTARHVLTGLHPFDGSLISETGYLPRLLRVFPTKSTSFERFEAEVDLETSKVIEDPEFENLRTDIAAVRVPIDNAVSVICLNDATDIFDEIFTQVGMECSVVGFPTENFGGLMTPVWRTGTIASEPLLAIDGKPMFLLDAATSSGFSGSPVFRRHYGPLPVHQPNGSLQIAIDSILKTSFVGVYAGRLKHNQVTGEVPFVFYGNRVPLLFSNLG